MASSKISHVVKQITRSQKVLSYYGKSPLYVESSKLDHVDSNVLPEIDVENRLKNEKNILDNFNHRKFKINFNWSQFIEKSNEWTLKQNQKIILEKELYELNKKVKNAEADDKRKLLALKKSTQKQKSQLNRDLMNYEENVIFPYLSLPNYIHEKCPINGQDEILEEFNSHLEVNHSQSHLELASNDIQMSSNSHTSFYLRGKLAKLEMNLQRKIESHLINEEYSQFSCPDFVWSLVLEGCGEDFTDLAQEFTIRPTKEIKERETGHAMHLVGSSSLYPFVSYYSKNVIAKSPPNFKSSHFCIGRRYRPVFDESSNLFNTQQSTSFGYFGISESQILHQQQFDEVLKNYKDLYEMIFQDKIKYRFVSRSADRISLSESYRVAVEIWAPSLNNYIEVGNLSMFGQYLSKRMMLKKEIDGEFCDLFVISGEIMNLTKVIGCLIEYKTI